MKTDSIHERAYVALMCRDVGDKLALTRALWQDWTDGRLRVFMAGDDPQTVLIPGRPDRPRLVGPRKVPVRRGSGRAARVALLHAIAHIEFNAINLALDCVMRYRSLPDTFHAGWAKVAFEEALHFGLVRDRLRVYDAEYGDCDAHNGLWEMACKSAHDPLLRMALVPRVLEARGLDATPPIMRRLAQWGDHDSVAVLEVILRDEVGHVALGDQWFRILCSERGLEPEACYEQVMRAFDAPMPRPPLHREARLAAGFSERELARFEAREGRQAGSPALRVEGSESGH